MIAGVVADALAKRESQTTPSQVAESTTLRLSYLNA
jgi:hypothetical protein